MKEKELKLLIDRDNNKKIIADYFSPQIDMLEDMVNYGSNLIIRSYDSSSKKIEDSIIIGVLLKHIVSMVDAVGVLISQCCVSPALLQARSALEASYYIDWMFKSDTSKKAKYYYVSDLRNQRLVALSCISGSKENQLYLTIFSGIDSAQSILDDTESIARATLTEIEATLEKNPWTAINKEFEDNKMKHKNTFVDPYWYKLCGISSIRKIAEAVGRLDEYELFYKGSSEVAHISSYRAHMQLRKGACLFEPIRRTNDFNIVLTSIGLVVLKTYGAILKYYRPDEYDSFKYKYIRDWKYPFLNIPSISYNTQPHIYGA